MYDLMIMLLEVVLRMVWKNYFSKSEKKSIFDLIRKEMKIL